MDARRAVIELRRLFLEAASKLELYRVGAAHSSWKAKVDSVLLGGLGPDSRTLHEFRDLRFRLGGGLPDDNPVAQAWFKTRWKRRSA